MRKDYERKYKFLLASFVFCSCGRRLTAEHHFKQSKGNKSRKTFSYYHCTRGKKCQQSRNIPTKDLESQVEEKFKLIKFSDKFYGKLLAKLKDKYNSHKEEVDDQVKKLKQLKAELIKKRDKAEELLFNGTINDDVYKRKTQDFEKEIDGIDENINSLGYKKNICLGEFKELMEFSKNTYNTYKRASQEVRRMYLGFFWDKFIYEGKQIIEARPTPLFEALLKLQEEMDKPKATAVAITQKAPEMEPIVLNTPSVSQANQTAYFFDKSFINLGKLGQALSGLITVLEDKEYMVTLREKMNNIKKVAKFYNYDLLLAKK